MKAVVINMASAKQRMAFMATQLTSLGLDFERIEAVTPDTVKPPLNDPFWTRWERPLRDVEKALYLSHRKLWQRVCDAGSPLLILEDDAVLSPSLPYLLARLGDGLDHLSFETRGRAKALGPAHPTLPLRRLLLDRSGAAAYALWPSGARKLLERPAGLADAVICAQTDWLSWQAVPALALQADQCARYGLEPPIPTASSIAASPRPKAKGGALLRYRLRRLASQLRMGLRQISATERREIEPAPDFFQ